MTLSDPLTPAELHALSKVGLMVTDSPSRKGGGPKYARDAALQGALSVDVVARMLGSTPDVIHQRIDDRTLLGVEAGSDFYLPATQFNNGRELPGLVEVLNAVPADVSAVMVTSWLQVPNADLPGCDEHDNVQPPEAPRSYLVRTGDSATVAALACGLGFNL